MLQVYECWMGHLLTTAWMGADRVCIAKDAVHKSCDPGCNSYVCFVFVLRIRNILN